MIKAVIIDDEPKNVRLLNGMLKEFCPQVQVIGEAFNAKEGKELILSSNPELVFLDIEMPYGNGFDLIDSLGQVSFEVIFVTAFDKYVLQAFKYSALDYLLKPVNIEELQAAVKNAEKRIGASHINGQLSLLLENLKKPLAGLQKIAVPHQHGYDFVPLTEIIYCEAKGAYTEIFLSGKRKLTVSKTIGEYESLLPEDTFFRIHHSTLVNLNQVKKYSRGRGGYVEMEDGTELEVSVRKKEEFLHRCGLR